MFVENPNLFDDFLNFDALPLTFGHPVAPQTEDYDNGKPALDDVFNSHGFRQQATTQQTHGQRAEEPQAEELQAEEPQAEESRAGELQPEATPVYNHMNGFTPMLQEEKIADPAPLSDLEWLNSYSSNTRADNRQQTKPASIFEQAQEHASTFRPENEQPTELASAAEQTNKIASMVPGDDGYLERPALPIDDWMAQVVKEYDLHYQEQTNKIASTVPGDDGHLERPALPIEDWMAQVVKEYDLHYQEKHNESLARDNAANLDDEDFSRSIQIGEWLNSTIPASKASEERPAKRARTSGQMTGETSTSQQASTATARTTQRGPLADIGQARSAK